MLILFRIEKLEKKERRLGIAKGWKCGSDAEQWLR
jgi:hypothetical protein